MTVSRPWRFALYGSGVALAAGVSWLMGSTAAGVSRPGWGIAGWAASTVPGVAGGVWMASRLGRPGAGFVAALGLTMAARAIAVGGGLIGALRVGDGATGSFLGGFATCFLPWIVFEIVWFVRESRSGAGEDSES